MIFKVNSERINTDQAQIGYDSIMDFFNFAEKLIDVAEYNVSSEKAVIFEIIEPVVESIDENANILAEQYRDYVFNDNSTLINKTKIENAIRTMFLFVSRCKKRLQQKRKASSDSSSSSNDETVSYYGYYAEAEEELDL